MNTVINEQDGKYIVSLEGELDTAHAIEVEEAMKPLHEVNGKEITKANGNKVVLRNLNNEIMDVFKMTGFIDLFVIE